MYWYLFEGFIPYFYCDMRSCAPVTARYWHRKYGDATKGIIQDTTVLFNVKASFHESTLLIINVEKYFTILFQK